MARLDKHMDNFGLKKTQAKRRAAVRATINKCEGYITKEDIDGWGDWSLKKTEAFANFKLQQIKNQRILEARKRLETLAAYSIDYTTFCKWLRANVWTPGSHGSVYLGGRVRFRV